MKSITFTNVLIVISVSVTFAARLTDDQIAQIFNGKLDRGSASDSVRSTEDIAELERKILTLERLEDVADQILDSENEPLDLEEVLVSKRPFCNGFTGCGRIRGKRFSSSDLDTLRLSDSKPMHESPSSDPASLTKRPFCNGFFGCGNPGKRLVFRNSPVVYTEGEKRLFCGEGDYGCRKRGKRSILLKRMNNLTKAND